MDTENMQFVILGSGDKEYEDYFNYMQAKYPGRLCFCHGFVPELARRFTQAQIFSLCRLLRSLAVLHR